MSGRHNDSSWHETVSTLMNSAELDLDSRAGHTMAAASLEPYTTSSGFVYKPDPANMPPPLSAWMSRPSGAGASGGSLDGSRSRAPQGWDPDASGVSHVGAPLRSSAFLHGEPPPATPPRYSGLDATGSRGPYGQYGHTGFTPEPAPSGFRVSAVSAPVARYNGEGGHRTWAPAPQSVAEGPPEHRYTRGLGSRRREEAEPEAEPWRPAARRGPGGAVAAGSDGTDTPEWKEMQAQMKRSEDRVRLPTPCGCARAGGCDSCDDVRATSRAWTQLARLRESIDQMSSDSSDVTRAVKQLEAEAKDADMWMAGVDKRVESMLRQAMSANDTLVQVQDSTRNLVSSEELEAVGKAAVEPALKRVLQAATREMERLGSRLTDDTRAAVAERVKAAVGAEEAVLAEVEAMRQSIQEVRAHTHRRVRATSEPLVAAPLTCTPRAVVQMEAVAARAAATQRSTQARVDATCEQAEAALQDVERLHAEAATRATRMQAQFKQLAAVQEEVPQLRDRLRERAEDEERRWQGELRRVQEAVASVNKERDAVAASAARVAAQQEVLREKEEEVE